MEIPRHWRLKDIRYRLMGWRFGKNGPVEIQKRPTPIVQTKDENHVDAEGTIFSSRLPLYTSGSCMVTQGIEPQTQEL